MSKPRCGLLYHFTHLENVPSILAGGDLLSDSAVRAASRLTAEAGDPAIKERRRRRSVPCGPGGFVGDYVPFYFAPRSPMMFKLSRGGVASFTGDHRDLVYWVTDVAEVVGAGLPFVFSDRNAAVAVAEFSSDPSLLGDLSKSAPHSDFVDWPLMHSTFWNNTPEAPDRMERRMAEFLVHERVPINRFLGLAVHSEAHRARLERLFVSSGAAPCPIEVRPAWFF